MISKVIAWLVIALVLFAVFRQFDPRSQGVMSAWIWAPLAFVGGLGFAGAWLKSVVEESTKRAVKEALEEWTKAK